MIENIRGKSRREKSLETREKIYTSAEKLFRSYGFEAVNVDDIVAEAGVAKGSFYVHFKSKDALTALIISSYVKKVDTNYETYLRSLPSDLTTAEVLISLVGKIADVLEQEIGVENMRFLYRTQLNNEHENVSLTDYNRGLYQLFEEVLMKGLDEGFFHSDLSIERLSRYCVTSYRGLVFEWCVRYPGFNLKEQVLEHFTIMMNGLQ